MDIKAATAASDNLKGAVVGVLAWLFTAWLWPRLAFFANLIAALGVIAYMVWGLKKAKPALVAVALFSAVNVFCAGFFWSGEAAEARRIEAHRVAQAEAAEAARLAEAKAKEDQRIREETVATKWDTLLASASEKARAGDHGAAVSELLEAGGLPAVGRPKDGWFSVLRDSAVLANHSKGLAVVADTMIGEMTQPELQALVATNTLPETKRSRLPSVNEKLGAFLQQPARKRIETLRLAEISARLKELDDGDATQAPAAPEKPRYVKPEYGGAYQFNGTFRARFDGGILGEDGIVVTRGAQYFVILGAAPPIFGGAVSGYVVPTDNTTTIDIGRDGRDAAVLKVSDRETQRDDKSAYAQAVKDSQTDFQRATADHVLAMKTWKTALAEWNRSAEARKKERLALSAERDEVLRGSTAVPSSAGSAPPSPLAPSAPATAGGAPPTAVGSGAARQ